MWDRCDPALAPPELRAFMSHIARSIDDLRRETQELMHYVKRAEYVRERLHRDMPGYWEDSVRLGEVKKRLGDAL